MKSGLALNILPKYCFSSFRFFEEHEKHITRVCGEDVLVIVFGGVLRFHENRVPVEVLNGQYYIQRRGLLQEGIQESAAPNYYYIHFLGNFEDGDNRLPIRGDAPIASLFPLFKKLDFLRVSGASAVEKAAVFYSILSELAKGGPASSGSTIVQRVTAEILRDTRRQPSLDEIAKSLGYCKNHIIHLFKRETGRTPYAYITGLRLDMAKQLLINSESSLAQISTECGYGRYINLYKAFVKAEGCAPLEWKKRHINGNS